MEGTTNGKHNDSPRPDDSEVDGPSGGKTKPNTYQTPSQTEHTWHKSSKKDKKTSKYISKRSRARKYVEKGNETLRAKSKSKRTSVTTYHDVDVKRRAKRSRATHSYNTNIASAHPGVWEACGKYEGGGAPNTNNYRTLIHPKSKFSKRKTTTMYGDCNSQYDGNRSQRLDRKSYNFSGCKV